MGAEMNKYKTGVYHLHLFDKHGTKRETRLLESFTAADLEGAAAVKQPPFASYSITRVLRNSLDEAYPWASDATVYTSGDFDGTSDAAA